ncbi:hypothetical protein Pmani_022980 [Petrolisthes manimaculis]|uniref:Myosin heavy chain n=1 Tax=Petrolisthes manimaculis TaxID=1843537 RepID=A0AAE1U3W3_9EUCA|nr:hypothetical protein Pmani_022980 [Petrolisthes manimaculis]
MPGHVARNNGPEPDPTEFLYVSLEDKIQDATKPFDAKKSCWVPDSRDGFVEGEIQGTKGDLVTVIAKGEVKTWKKDLGAASQPTQSNSTKAKRRNEVPPHLFAISDGAYIAHATRGESGAGKTENTKKVLSYFANVGGASNTRKKEGEREKPNLEDQIVMTNPVLEAFGNAKTVRNDNSSRFGKFIRIHFGGSGKLSGSDIEVYLLEKARVISQQPLERSYHIFYEMMSDQIKEIKPLCHLSDDIFDYPYVSQGKVTVPSIDDAEDMQFCHDALDILGFSRQEVEDVYQVTAAVMHLGNMKFRQRGREEQAEPNDTQVGEILGKLLGVDGSDLYKNITKPKIKVGAEFVAKGMNMNQCYYSVGALAKALFDRLFKWLVSKCNVTLETGLKRTTFIGVLDISGFEIFDYNGFEQICINFCNEKLQQFFNHHMFVLEQEEYKREGINWTYMDFGMDLQACIELFEKKLGLFSILEEESMFPKATDKTFQDKLNANHLGKTPVFIKPKSPKPGETESHFAVVHYAGTVSYNLTGWLEKNKDPLNDTVVDQLKKATNQLTVSIFADHPGQSGTGDSKGAGKKAATFKTVSSCYKVQYKILAPKDVSVAGDDQRKMAKVCFDKAGLDEELYRLGNTKVFFRPGVLGTLEEIRDDRLSKMVTWLQAWIRGFIARKAFKKLEEQRVALQVVQRSIRQFLKMRSWPWFMLWQKVKPILSVTRIEDEMKALEEKAATARADYERESNLRRELEVANEALIVEKTNLIVALESTRGNVSEYLDKQAKLESHKTDLEAQLSDVSKRLQLEQESHNRTVQIKKKSEQEVSSLRRDIEELEMSMQKAEQEKASKDHQIRALNEEITRQEQLFMKVNKDKKHLQECNQKTAEDLQSIEDKCNHLNKVKAKLEQTIDELEDSLEREKKLRGDIEKSKRKLESDCKLTHEAMNDLERHKKELEQVIERKDKEYCALGNKLEEEQGLVCKTQRLLKEMQARMEEMEEEMEHERQTRTKIEKAKVILARELEELGERLEEAGGATAAQIELNKKREGELAKLRRDLEETNIQHESSMLNLRKKHNDAVAEMSEQIDHLSKMKAKSDKEKEVMRREAEDAKTTLDGLARDKAGAEKTIKQLQQEVHDLQAKVDESNRTLSDYDALKKKLTVENLDLLRQVEEAESQLGLMSKLKLSLTNQLEDTRQLLDDESRERATLVGKIRNLEHDIDGLREQLQEESDGKADVQRQLSKTNAEAQMWRAKYESEGVARAEELEAANVKLTSRLEDAESQIELLNVKNLQLEKGKQRVSTELEDMQLAAERAQLLACTAEKKQRNFDKIIGEWKLKVDDLTAELDSSQKECRNYSTELFRVKAAYEENLDQLDSIRRENKNLVDEIKDLMDQIGEGGRSLHDVQKNVKRLEIEKEELQAALEEAEAALEQEENKVLRGQLEMSQVRQEIDRRIQEKEEEFDNTRKCHQRAIDSIQASLEAEAKGKAEALRLRKKVESDVNELEIALDHSNKANADLQKYVKKMQAEMRDMQTRIEEEQHFASEYREQFSSSDRRGNSLLTELEESRTLLEQSDRGRRQAESELAETQEQLSVVTANNNTLTTTRRKMESELQTLHADLDELLSEAKNSEEKAKKAMIDAARLADELRAEQEHAQTQEKMRKSLEITVKELQARLDESENIAIKNGKRSMGKLEGRIRELESQLDDEARRHSDAQKNLRKCERRMKELTFQADEDKKNHERMQDLVDKLQQKIKTYKRQIEEAEEIAALNLAKYRKAQQELDEYEERDVTLVGPSTGPLTHGSLPLFNL